MNDILEGLLRVFDLIFPIIPCFFMTQEIREVGLIRGTDCRHHSCSRGRVVV